MSVINVPAPPGTHKFCAGCGREIAVADHFCPYCGAESPVNVEPVAPVAPPTWVPPGPVARATPPSKSRAWRWIVGCVAALLLVGIAIGGLTSNKKSTTPGGTGSPAT